MQPDSTAVRSWILPKGFENQIVPHEFAMAVLMMWSTHSFNVDCLVFSSKNLTSIMKSGVEV